VELKSLTTSSGLRATKHNTNLLTKLINENDRSFRLANSSSQFTKSLAHHTCLHTHHRITDFPIQFLLWSKSCNRVNYNQLNSTRTNKLLSNIKSLLTRGRLRN